MGEYITLSGIIAFEHTQVLRYLIQDIPRYACYRDAID